MEAFSVFEISRLLYPEGKYIIMKPDGRDYSVMFNSKKKAEEVCKIANTEKLKLIWKLDKPRRSVNANT